MNTKIKISFAKRQKGAVEILCIVCALFFMAAGCAKQDSDSMDMDFPLSDYYYTEQDEVISLTVSYDKVIIKAKSANDAKELCRQSIFSSAYQIGFDDDARYHVIATVDPSKTKLGDLLKRPEVVNAAYGLKSIDGSLHYPNDVIFVKCKEGQSPDRILESIELSKKVVSVELFDSISEIYLVTLDIPFSDALSTCRKIFESGLCKFAEPSFFLELKFKL